MIDKILSHYRINAPLGRGGMGVVYLATDISLGRKVALKVLPPSEVNAEQRARFLLEARAASALNHPGIVTIYEAGSDQGIDYIAMEHIAGSTLREIIDKKLPRFVTTVDYAVQMADALGKAHAAGIIHRDLKPGNVMVNEDSRVKILDFGLARMNSVLNADSDATQVADLTRPGMVLGTLFYMSPEQARGEHADARSDIFSFSVMLYEMLTGVRPFTGNSALSILTSLATHNPLPVSQVNQFIPPEADAVVARGLAKIREERYSSILEMSEDLRSVAEGLAPPSTLSRLPMRVPIAAGPVHVPRYRTSFLGREDEIAQLKRLFMEPRIVTLVAGGGTGKTRLACEAATAMAGNFPDGVFVIELADGTAEDVLVRAVEILLGRSPLARVEGANDPAAAIEAWLENRHALLILDNCEHVTTTIRKLITRWSKACRGISFLSTSREVVGAPGEQVLRLNSLSVAPDGMSQSPAFALFLARATEADDKFKLDDEQGRAVREICERLEGLPLAIELAASRVRALAPSQIVARLDDSLKLLKTRGDGESGRHRSLEATIRWSYDLLNPEEQSLLAKLSVFVGGFDLAAVEAVADQDGDEDPLDLIASLVDKSLVYSDAVLGTVRYRFPEPVRQFATAKLEETGNAKQLKRAHFTHYLALARKEVPKLDDAPDLPLVERLSREHGNFTAAIERARQAGEFSDAGALVLALNSYWNETGRIGVASTVIRTLVESSPRDPAMVPVLALGLTYGLMCGKLREAFEGLPLLEAVVQAPLPPVVESRIRFAMGFTCNAVADYEGLSKYWVRAAELSAAGDPIRGRQMYWTISYSAFMLGHFEDSRKFLERALSISTPMQGWFVPMVRINRCCVSILESEGQADPVVLNDLRSGLIDLAALAVSLRVQLGSIAGASAFFHAGAFEDAEHWWRRALQLNKDMGGIWGSWMVLELAGRSAALSSNYAQCAKIWGAVDAFGAQHGYRTVVPSTSRVPDRAQVRSLDPARYDRCAAEGAAVPLSRIVDETLDDPFRTVRKFP